MKSLIRKVLDLLESGDVWEAYDLMGDLIDSKEMTATLEPLERLLVSGAYEDMAVVAVFTPLDSIEGMSDERKDELRQRHELETSSRTTQGNDVPLFSRRAALRLRYLLEEIGSLDELDRLSLCMESFRFKS